mgnify:CR=1 FL=1|jgi:hypothetical protein
MLNSSRLIISTLLMIIVGSQLYGQNIICDEAKIAAKQEMSEKSWLWLGAGMTLSVVGVAASYIVEPPKPSPMQLLGKDANTIQEYSSCFQKQAKHIQVKNAWIGCTTEFILINLFTLMIVISL